jgi:flagellar hook-associated protein 1 FlgK
MASLFTALGTAGSSLDVIEQAIGVIQNNVTNASTPGYVTQTLQLASRPFDLSEGSLGGVEATGVQSARDVYAEQSVWSANEQAGLSSQESASLNQLQQIFDVSGQSGIPGALSTLYSAFSAWSTSPSDATAQQSVITAAQGLSSAFSQTFSQAQQISSDTDQQLSSSVSQLNQYTAQIATLNGEIRTTPGNDAGLQAQLYNTIEEVSNLAPITVNMQSDGTATVLLGGQSPLVQGTTQNNVTLNYAQSATATNPNAPPSAQLLNFNGQDITSLVNQGTIGGALNFVNTTMPAIIGNGQQQGSLNQLAQGVADRINTLLSGGQVSAGPPPVSGVPLFTYDATTPTGIAGSLSVAANITGSQLAATSPGPPSVANGVANELANMANPTNAADMLSGFSYTDYYGNIATDVGQQASTASNNDTTNTNVLNQAQSLRATVSGVSLNDQATQLLQFQESYQASAQMISTINTLTQSLLTVMQDASS